MQHPRSVFNQAFIAAFLVVGCVATSAIAFNYTGKLQFKVGADGIQLQINGRDK